MSVAIMAEVRDQEGKSGKAAKDAKRAGAVVRELLTVPEFAGALGVTDAAVRKWLYQGRLQKVKLGRSVRLRRRDLDRLVTEGLGAKQLLN
jgi:excisionase family DNA binding protein